MNKEKGQMNKEKDKRQRKRVTDREINDRKQK